MAIIFFYLHDDTTTDTRLYNWYMILDFFFFFLFVDHPWQLIIALLKPNHVFLMMII